MIFRAFHLLRKLHIFVYIIILASCQNGDRYRQERIAKADEAFKLIKSRQFPENVQLSLPFCINLALKNNLDLRVYELKEAVSREQRTAAALGMLPDLTITNDIAIRNNEPGASSYSLLTGVESVEPSQSSQKFENRVKVELLFSIIDFGLAYYNAVQAADKTLIAIEQKRRATQNLILDVSRAYFKVAAAQYAMEHTEKMLKLSDSTEKLLAEMVKNKKLPLEKIVIEKKTFLVLKKSLMEYRRSYENSCIQLSSLMGYHPKNGITVDTTQMGKLIVLKVPDVELLDEISLIERPELYQLDIQLHITAVAARKKIIEMFPNVGLFTDFTNSTNKYLYNQTWFELGARAAYRLMRVPQLIGEYVALESAGEQLEAQTLALSVGVLSQVRIAHANLTEVRQRYDIAEQLFETYKLHEAIKEERSSTAGALSVIELNRMKMETAQKDIERTQALGNYYLAYFRLLNSIGLESMDAKAMRRIKKRIEEAYDNTSDIEIEKMIEYMEEMDEYTEEIEVLNNKITAFEEIKINGTKASSDEYDKLVQTRNETVEHKKNLSGNVNEGYNSKISNLSDNLKSLQESLVIEKENYEKKVQQVKNEYHYNVSLHRQDDSHDEKFVAKLGKDYEISLSNTRKKHIKLVDSINKKIAAHGVNIETVNTFKAEENKKLVKHLKVINSEHEKNLAMHHENKSNFLNQIDETQPEIDGYRKTIKELEDQKNIINKKFKISKEILEEQEIRLAKYVKAIDLLSEKNIVIEKKTTSNIKQTFPEIESGNVKVIHHIQKDADAVANTSGITSAPSDVSNLIMETQLQSGNNSIPFEEFSPEATKNIELETQSNADNNDINIESFNPETQDNILLQTLRDSDNNEINFQEYSNELNTREDKIGNSELNNSVNKELGKNSNN